MLGSEAVRTEVDGVPVFWAPQHTEDGEAMALLTFRYGATDGDAGAAALLPVAMQLLAETASRDCPAFAHVGPYLSSLELHGSQVQILGALGRVWAWLWHPDTADLPRAQAALAGSRRSRRTLALGSMLRHHFGLFGPGLLAAALPGLVGQVDELALMNLVQQRILLSRATLSTTFEPPDELRIPLPASCDQDLTLPHVPPLPPRSAPSRSAGETATVSLLVPRHDHLDLAAELFGAHLEERLGHHGRPEVGFVVASRDLSLLHASVRAPEAQDLGEELLAAVEDLASGSRPDLVRAVRRRWTETLDTPFWAPLWARTWAQRTLLGEEFRPAIALTAGLSRFTGESLAAAVRPGLPTVSLALPAGVPEPAPHPWPVA